MHFSPTPIPGLLLLDLEKRHDERGFYGRLWCRDEWESRSLNSECRQVSLAANCRRGTLRGLHYQAAPYAEAKTVRVVRGAVHDVVLDVRPESPAFGAWFATELTAENRRALYVPEGCAHGYITLCDDSELLYVLSGEHQPTAERGVHWQCPVLRGAWPFPPQIVSPRDAQLPQVWPPAS